MTAKGVKRGYVTKHVQHSMFFHTLQNKIFTSATFKTIRALNHTLNTIETTKSCLSAYDDKRYILDDGVSTLAYGHYNIPIHAST
jgi:hypothetical protein